MSPQCLAHLQKFVDGQRLFVELGSHPIVISKAYHPQYVCPLKFFKEMQRWYRVDEAY